jgi:hypothetical protein
MGEIAPVNDVHSAVPVTEHPTSEEIAAYLSGRLASADKAALEAHLADCAECRQQVTSARRVLRAHRKSASVRWLVPAAAAATVAIVLLARNPGVGGIREEPLRSDSGVGGLESALTIPIVYPIEASTVSPDSLVFVWRAQSGNPLYRLSLTDDTGHQVWGGSTSDTSLALPGQVRLARGQSYFWTVDALTGDGQSLTTRSKRFSITP